VVAASLLPYEDSFFVLKKETSLRIPPNNRVIKATEDATESIIIAQIRALDILLNLRSDIFYFKNWLV
jgi:hypothetical protein